MTQYLLSDAIFLSVWNLMVSLITSLGDAAAVEQWPLGAGASHGAIRPRYNVPVCPAPETNDSVICYHSFNSDICRLPRPSFAIPSSLITWFTTPALPFIPQSILRVPLGFPPGRVYFLSKDSSSWVRPPGASQRTLVFQVVEATELPLHCSPAIVRATLSSLFSSSWRNTLKDTCFLFGEECFSWLAALHQELFACLNKDRAPHVRGGTDKRMG